MQFIEQNKPMIEALCRQYQVRRLYAFGSVLSDRFSNESDIDLLVDFENIDLKHYADHYYSFKFALEKVLHHPIDLIELKALRNPYFKQNIEAHRLLLYAA